MVIWKPRRQLLVRWITPKPCYEGTCVPQRLKAVGPKFVECRLGIVFQPDNLAKLKVLPKAALIFENSESGKYSYILQRLLWWGSFWGFIGGGLAGAERAYLVIYVFGGKKD